MRHLSESIVAKKTGMYQPSGKYLDIFPQNEPQTLDDYLSFLKPKGFTSVHSMYIDDIICDANKDDTPHYDVGSFNKGSTPKDIMTHWIKIAVPGSNFGVMIRVITDKQLQRLKKTYPTNGYRNTKYMVYAMGRALMKYDTDDYEDFKKKMKELGW